MNSDRAGRESDGEDDSEPDAHTVSLSVPDMDCPTCARKVDGSLERAGGTIDTDLRPTTGRVDVTFDPARTGPDAVIEAVEAAGYEVVDAAGPGRGPEGGERPAAVDIAPPAQIWTGSRAKKTWIGAVFVVLGLLLAFAVPGELAVVDALWWSLSIADLLFIAAAATSGLPVVRNGYYSARNWNLDIDLLMGTAIVAATAIGYFVEAATLAVLFSIAELLEDYAMDRARDSLRELMELSPETATVRRDGGEVTVPVEEVAIGETVIVRPGGKIPVDGTVVDGESAVDQSPITGESVPVDKTVGDEVYAGAINETGYLGIEVTALAADSTLARIIEMVQGAQAEKTETEQFVDRFADYYTPIVVVLAILTAAIPPLVIGAPVTVTAAGYGITFAGDWGTWFVRGLTLLVIACPCAFVISTPVSVVSGITSAAKEGVLIKGGDHLEAMGAVDVVAFDKTGTLTKGKLGVTDVVAFGDADERTVLRHAAALEARSEHPIARAILERADAAGATDRPEPTGFETVPGKGVSATIEGERYHAGKPALFEEVGLDLQSVPTVSPGAGGRAARQTAGGGYGDEGGSAVQETVADLAAQGKTVVLVGTDSAVLGVIAIADEVREGVADTIDRLHRLGIERVVMLTGDNEGTARAIADEVGVDEYRAELLPDEKVEAVRSLQREAGAVAMVGDGINDAPALAVAEVGIAMGAAGTDTALETADIALMGDDVGKLPYLYSLSNTANGVIRQNIWASLGVKFLLALGVPLGLVSVALAVVVGDMGMSLGVTGNAMRLARIRSASSGAVS
jgi:Cd2+/Zn2+-exporting ATPase